MTQLPGAPSQGATASLRGEHRIIERMLHVLEVAVTKLSSGERLSPQLFEAAVDFIRNFADKCHHGKEEGHLFPLLERRGFSREAGPLAVMLQEHDAGRRFVRGLAEAIERYRGGDDTARQQILQNARGYVDLLTQHIFKEDNILFMLADRTLSPMDQTYLTEKFEELEVRDLGPGKHHEYEELVKRLEAQLET